MLSRDHILQTQLAVHSCVLVDRHLLHYTHGLGLYGHLGLKSALATINYTDIDIAAGCLIFNYYCNYVFVIFEKF